MTYLVLQAVAAAAFAAWMLWLARRSAVGLREREERVLRAWDFDVDRRLAGMMEADRRRGQTDYDRPLTAEAEPEPGEADEEGDLPTTAGAMLDAIRAVVRDEVRAAVAGSGR